MTTEFRRRILGDVDASDPDGWQWGGPSTRPVDLLLLLYARDQDTLAGLYEEQAAGFAAGGLVQIGRLDTSTLTDREHFGFRDGISQPTVEGLGRSNTPANTIKAGEFVLGYQNEYDKYTDRPTVPASADPAGLLPPYPDSSERARPRPQRQLPGHPPARPGRPRLLAIRGRCDPWARRRRRPRGTHQAGREDGRAVAERRAGDRLAGRRRPDAQRPQRLRLRPVRPSRSQLPDRRPRPAHPPARLARSGPGTDRSIELDKRHRLLRRGRAYGPTVPPEERLADAPADVEPRAAPFHLPVRQHHPAVRVRPAHLGQQSEVRRHVRRRRSADRPARARTARRSPIPRTPVRERITGIPTFVTVRGGGYFFLPGPASTPLPGQPARPRRLWIARNLSLSDTSPTKIDERLDVGQVGIVGAPWQGGRAPWPVWGGSTTRSS